MQNHSYVGYYLFPRFTKYMDNFQDKQCRAFVFRYCCLRLVPRDDSLLLLLSSLPAPTTNIPGGNYISISIDIDF